MGIIKYGTEWQSRQMGVKMSNITERVNQYQDYKYVLQDTGNIYLGAKFTYEEIMDREDVSFKIKAIIEHYITKEITFDTSLESHFYYMKPKDFAARTYEQLKVKVKVSELKTRKGLFGKEKESYTDVLYKLPQFMELSEEEKKRKGIMIQEIGISKLALMTFPV